MYFNHTALNKKFFFTWRPNLMMMMMMMTRPAAYLHYQAINHIAYKTSSKSEKCPRHSEPQQATSLNVYLFFNR